MTFLMIASFLTLVPTVAGADDKLDIELMEYDPLPAEAGEYFDMWVKVENSNMDYPAENVTCQIDPEYPFSLDANQPVSGLSGNSPEKRNIGTLPQKDYKIFQYRLRTAKDAVNGWNSVKFWCQSEDRDIWVSENLDIKVDEGVDLGIGGIDSDPLEMVADTEDVKVTVEIENTGGKEGRMVDASLDLPEGFKSSHSYSLRDNIGKIEDGDMKEAVFYLDVGEDVPSGVHTAVMTLEYERDSETISEEFEIPLKVQPSPDFSVENVKVSPEDLAQGDSAELRFDVVNGGEKADSTVVKVYKETSQPFDFDEKNDYIGELSEGESSEAVFSFSVDPDAELKKHLLDVEIRYVEGDDVKTYSETVPVEVVSRKDSNLMEYGAVGLLVLAAGYIGYRKFGG